MFGTTSETGAAGLLGGAVRGEQCMSSGARGGGGWRSD